MNKIKHNRHIFELSRFMIICIIIMSMINILGLSRLDIIGVKSFLEYYNWTTFVGLALFVCWMDYKKYDLINRKVSK